MNKNSKKILAVSLLAIAGLASCGNNQQGSNEIAIEWWVPASAADPESSASYVYAKSVADAYHELHPETTVNVVAKGSKNNDYAGCANAVSDSLTGGNTPNMVTTYGTYVAAWNQSAPGAVADVTAKAQTLEADTDFNQSYLVSEKQQYGTAYYSLPYSKSGEFLQYNKEVFAATDSSPAGHVAGEYPAPAAATTKEAYAVPTTLEDTLAVARKIKADYPEIPWGERDESGNFKAIPLIYESATNLWVTALESNGITLIDPSAADITQSVPFLDNPEAKTIAKNLKVWCNEGLFCTVNQLPTNAQGYHEYPSTMVTRGLSMMMITSTANAPWDAVDGYSVGFAKVPAFGARARTLSQGPSVAFFNHADAKELEATLAFYDFLTNTENSANLATSTYYYPVRKSSYETEAIKAAIDAAAKGDITHESAVADKKTAYLGDSFNINKAIDDANEYFMSPVNELSAKVRTGMQGIVDNILNDKDATSTQAIEALVDAQFAAAKQAIFA